LFFIDVATGAQRDVGDVGKEFRPSSSQNPGVRFSLAPDGKSFVYGTAKSRSNLWMLEGFDRKAALLERLGLR
jgi:hypothetical protein